MSGIDWPGPPPVGGTMAAQAACDWSPGTTGAAHWPVTSALRDKATRPRAGAARGGGGSIVFVRHWPAPLRGRHTKGGQRGPRPLAIRCWTADFKGFQQQRKPTVEGMTKGANSASPLARRILPRTLPFAPFALSLSL